PGGLKVTLQRPGNGAGGDCWHQEHDPYDPSSPRNTFAHWDAPFIAWLEARGYEVDYCVDLDIHRDADVLTPYR
ncbi:N,N-dimethylformamidase beta subunit family domain-containing protein, partial [Jeotgalibacillus marinus]